MAGPRGGEGVRGVEGEKSHAKPGWDGPSWDGPRNLRFSCHGTQADSGFCSRCVGHLSAVPRGSSPLLHAGGKWASQRQTAKRAEVL